jgi:hypothetical protein
MTRLLANKLSSLSVTREEYVLLKALVLLNSGKFQIWKLAVTKAYVLSFEDFFFIFTRSAIMY